MMLSQTARLRRSNSHAVALLADLPAMPGAVRCHARDSEIFAEGDPADRIYTVVSGAVRICKLTRDGRRQIASFRLPGEYFALEAGLRHGFSAEAITESRIVAFPRKTVLTKAREDHDLGEWLWQTTGSCLERAEEHMMLLGRGSALERVAMFLLDMAARAGEGDRIRLPMSRLDIADYLGLTIETVSRTLTQLERDGVITMPAAREIALRDRRALMALEA